MNKITLILLFLIIPIITFSQDIGTTITVEDSTCSQGCNGAILLQSTGGSGDYEYSLDDGTTYTSSNSFTDLCAGTYVVTTKDSNNDLITITAIIDAPPAINLSNIITGNHCYGDSNAVISVTATGGSGSYEYQLQDSTGFVIVDFNSNSSFAGIGAGEYVITVKDTNECAFQEVITILESSPIVAEAIQTSGNSIAIPNVTGGMPPYQYSIDGGATYQPDFVFENLSSGTYIPMVLDAYGCISISNQIIIEEPTELVINTIANTSCSGENSGEIIVEVMGGIPPYEFSIDDGSSWQSSNTFSNLSGGEYQINIRDANLSMICSCATNPFENGNFEDNASIVENGTFSIVDESLINGWETTATDNAIEVWQSGFLGIDAYEGDYFVDLSANQNSSLYQEFCTKEGDVIEWQVAHRGRSGTDVAEVRIGGGLITTTLEQTMSTGNTSWVLYTGTYVVPENQSSTIIAFETVSTASGNLSVGNLLDAINVSFVNNTCSPISVIIEESEPLVSEISIVSNSISITTTGGIPPYEYSIDGGTTYQASSTFDALQDGTYQIITTDSNTCTEISEEIVIVSINATDDLITTNKDTSITIAIFSNDTDIPVNGILTVTTPVNGIISVDDNGTSNDTSDDVVIYTPNSDFFGTDIFDYTICDNNTSANCDTASVTVFVENIEELIVTTTITDISCYGDNNGAIEVAVSGGQAPYRYQLTTNDGVTIVDVNSDELFYAFSALQAGEYQVKVTDASFNYVIEDFVTITSPEELVAFYSFENPTCNGESNGSIEVVGSGGSGEYRYGLNGVFQDENIFYGLTAGVYDLILQDLNGCETIASTLMIEPEAIVISGVTVVPTGNQASGSIKIEATGGVGSYTYTINGGLVLDSNEFFDLPSGTYDILVMDQNGCTSSVFTVTIEEINIDNSVAEKSTGGLEANYQNATSYQWINVDTKTRIPGATSRSFIPSEYGRYQVEITVTGSEKISSKSVYIQNTQVVLSPIINYTSGVLGVNDFGLNTFKVYPNPAIDFITVPASLLGNNYRIYDLLGKQVNTGKITNETIDLVEYSQGVYFLKVKEYKVVKFIKK